MREYQTTLHFDGSIDLQLLYKWRRTFPADVLREPVVGSVVLEDGALVTEDDVGEALTSVAHDDVIKRVFFRDHCRSEPWVMEVTWVNGPPGWAEAEITAPTTHDLAQWVQRLQQYGLAHKEAPAEVSNAALGGETHDAVEAVLTWWQRKSTDLGLDPESLRIGDTLASTSAELLRNEKPPRQVLASILRWFGAKADVFATKAAESAGEAVGPAIKAGALLAAGRVTGLWGELHELVSTALRRLEE